MIHVQDQTIADGQWYDIEVEILPCKSFWNHSHRWFGEVHARISNWPQDDGHGIWNHYHFIDFGTWTLRGAWFHSWKAINELEDYIKANPNDRPDRQ